MSAQLERDEAFWRLVGALDKAGVLRHVMIIGTWAEWLFTDYFEQTAGVGVSVHLNITQIRVVDKDDAMKTISFALQADYRNPVCYRMDSGFAA